MDFKYFLLFPQQTSAASCGFSTISAETVLSHEMVELKRAAIA